MGSEMIFALFMAVLFFGAIAWLSIYARRHEGNVLGTENHPPQPQPPPPPPPHPPAKRKKRRG